MKLLGPDGLPIKVSPRETGRKFGAGLRASAGFGEMGGDYDSGPLGEVYGGLSDQAYEGASRTNPDLAGWEPFPFSGESALRFSRDRLANRIHDLVRSDGWASAAVTRVLDSVIGSGWRLHSTPNAQLLGIGPDETEQLQKSIEAAWHDYSENCEYIDAGQRLDFTGILTLAFRHFIMDGEACSLSLWDEKRSDYHTCIQIIDPDRLSNPHLWLDSVTRRGGVELGEFGQPTGYWFRSAHPGDLGVVGSYPWRWLMVEKRYPNGRHKCVHSFKPMRSGMVRGEPMLAPILRKVRMLTKYDNCELQAAVLNALLAAFVKSPNDPEQLARSFESEENDSLSPQQASRLGFYEKSGLKMPNVTMKFLYPNDEVDFKRPEHPNANFENFMRTGLRNVASVAGVSYEQLTGDYSQTNYSSARGALLEIWRGFKSKRQNFASVFANPHFENFLEEAIAKGVVKLPKGAPAFREAKSAYCSCRWLGPGMSWIDPQKEVTAAIARMNSGISTLQIECSELGLDWQEVMKQRAREYDEMKKLGLPIPMTQDMQGKQQPVSETMDDGYEEWSEQNSHSAGNENAIVSNRRKENAGGGEDDWDELGDDSELVL